MASAVMPNTRPIPKRKPETRRQKEQFSDGVGYQWIDGVKEYARNKYPGDLFEERRKLYPVNTPNTPEELLYRELFHEHFPEERENIQNYILCAGRITLRRALIGPINGILTRWQCLKYDI